MKFVRGKESHFPLVLLSSHLPDSPGACSATYHFCMPGSCGGGSSCCSGDGLLLRFLTPLPTICSTGGGEAARGSCASPYGHLQHQHQGSYSSILVWLWLSTWLTDAEVVPALLCPHNSFSGSSSSLPPSLPFFPSPHSNSGSHSLLPLVATPGTLQNTSLLVRDLSLGEGLKLAFSVSCFFLQTWEEGGPYLNLAPYLFAWRPDSKLDIGQFLCVLQTYTTFSRILFCLNINNFGIN